MHLDESHTLFHSTCPTLNIVHAVLRVRYNARYKQGLSTKSNATDHE